MNCIIIDDDQMSRKSLEILCDKVDHINVLGVFSSALQAIEAVKQYDDLHLIFLDIHMPDLNGFDFLKTLKERPKVIFTTSDPNKAIEAFEVEALDYLIKPITFPRFLSAVGRITLDKDSKSSTSNEELVYEEEIFVNTDKRLVRIAVNDISVIEAKGDYILIKLSGDQTHIVRSTLKSIETRLSPKKFIKVHRSFIVNISKIVDIEDSSMLVNNQIVPISRSHKQEVIDRLNLL